MVYNVCNQQNKEKDMKKILCVQECDIAQNVLSLLCCQESLFAPSEKKVQGATLAKTENAVLVCSPKRFKVYHEGNLFVHILEGKGFFKWAKGETAFSQGFYLIEDAEEVEINGNSKFIYVKS